MTEAKSTQNWKPGDCPMCGVDCIGGAHRLALAKDGIETPEQYQALKSKSAQPQLPPLDENCKEEKRKLPEGAPYGAFLECELSCRERQLLSALAENESLKAAKPLRMFVWDGRGAYKISVCAPSVAEARTLALDEIAVHGMSEIEGSPMFRAKAQVKQEQPHIYLRPNAELVLSENGETEELNICLESTESQLAAMKAERDQALEVIREYRDMAYCTKHRHGLADTRCPTCIKADELLTQTKE